MKKQIAISIAVLLIVAFIGGFIGHSINDQPAVFVCDSCGIELYETIHYCSGCAADEIGAGTFCNDCFFEIHC